jgi:hypothetical protein
MPNLRIPTFLQAAALYAAALTLFGGILFATPGFLGTDDYYHARITTEIVAQRRLALDFPWLPLTILSPERFTDHHLLFHLYLVPFTVFGDVVGAKIGTLLIAAGIVVAAWALLRRIGVRYPALWALGMFAVSMPFLVRLLMIRTQGASLLLLIVALLLLAERRYRWLIPLSFAYAWLYNGFVLMPAFAGLYTLSAWLVDRRFEPRPLIYSLTGIALGLAINPYFPRNIAFIWDHLTAKVDIAGSIRLGNEWYPYETTDLLYNSRGALIALALGLIAPSLREGKRDRMETTLLFGALVTLFMLMQSRRFIEYFPAFALLFGAAAWGRGIDFAALLPARLRWRPLLPLIGAAALIALIVEVYPPAYYQARDARSPDSFRGASAWLRENAPDGAVIFQTDWDDFTRLFFYNPENTYIVGLDPTYLQLADPVKWDQWRAITRGEVDTPSSLINFVFRARYVVSDAGHEAFREQAAADPAMEVVYQDQYNYVWRIDPAESP